jgi:DNA-binding LacI/PurR family transcriptional regulator
VGRRNVTSPKRSRRTTKKRAGRARRTRAGSRKDERGQVSLAPIAEKAGVSRMTVSRVLRGEAIVLPETRDRVLRIARQLGYRPNPLVRALMAQRRSGGRRVQALSIAYLTSFGAGTAWRRHETYCSYFEGARARADQLGYHLEEFPTRGLKPDRITAALQQRGFQGVIVGPRPEPGDVLDLDWSAFGLAAIGMSLKEPRLHKVSPDHYAAMTLAIDEVRRLGYARLGLVIAAETDARFLHLWRAALAVAAEHAHVPSLLLETWDRAAVADWYRTFEPDLVFGTRRDLVVWIESTGVKVPDDLGYVHFAWEEPLGLCTGVDLRGQTVGAAAVDLVVEQLTTNERGVPESAKHVALAVRWLAGRTTRARAGGRRPGAPRRRTHTTRRLITKAGG